MSTADQVESYVNRAPRTVREAATSWAGRHRAESRAKLGMRRMFYIARHRARQRSH